MSQTLIQQWQTAFWQTVKMPDVTAALQNAGQDRKLEAWTKHLTAAIVTTNNTLGWQTAAKGNRCGVIPIRTQEFLTIDAIAFPEHSPPWSFPIAIIELENQRDRALYSLWKVLNLRAQMRLVFCYCETAEERADLITTMKHQIIVPLTLQEQAEIQGKTVIVIGSRDHVQTFPYGYFKWWELDIKSKSFTILN